MLFDKLRKPQPAFVIKDESDSSFNKVHVFIMIAIGLFFSLKEGVLSHNITFSKALVHVALVYAIAYFVMFRKKKPAPLNEDSFDAEDGVIVPAVSAGSSGKFPSAKTPMFKPLPGTPFKPVNTPNADPVVRGRKLPSDGRIKPGWFS